MARILIADDEDLERQALGLIISEVSAGEDFSVVEAKNGPEALSLGVSGDFDIIFLDVKMPGMDGIAVAEGLRSAGIQSAIVIVSAYDTFEYAQKAIRLGVYEYLLKPASREDVVKALLRSLELQRAPESLARLRRESVSVVSSALERLEGQMIREMERGEMQNATAADFEKLASLEGLPKSALAFRLDTGGKKSSPAFDRALFAVVFDEASKALSSAVRILGAKTEEGGRFLVYGDDPTGIEAASGLNKTAWKKEALKYGSAKGPTGFSRRLRLNPLAPVILAVEERLLATTSFRLLWGLSGPTSLDPADLVFSRALEACRLACADCALVCLGTFSGEKAKSVIETNPQDRAKPGFALRTLAILREDCAKDWSLETLANELGTSPFHLSHMLSRELGMGFSELLQRLRIGRAKEILAGGGSAKEASYLTGFSDQAYFTKVFKKLEGQTPGEYQNEIAKKYQ
jgi:two-component system response regulator YesN